MCEDWYSSAMYKGWVKLNNVMNQAVLQQSNKIAYTTHQCFKTGYSSVMQYFMGFGYTLLRVGRPNALLLFQTFLGINCWSEFMLKFQLGFSRNIASPLGQLGVNWELSSPLRENRVLEIRDNVE